MQDNFKRMLSTFRANTKASGLMEEIRRREYALGPSERKREKQKTALARNASELRKKNWSARSRNPRIEGYVRSPRPLVERDKSSDGTPSDD